MPTKEPMSWKMRTLIVIAVVFLFGIGFVFTSWGFDTMKGWMDNAYNEAPAAERADHWTADYYLSLAWWEAVVCRRRAEGKSMLLEFLGILPDGRESFRDAFLAGHHKWNGKFDPKTKQSWGILHPRACEAYYLYLETDKPDTSMQETTRDAAFYKVLFFDQYGLFTNGKAHPQFYKYWARVKQMIDPRFLFPGFQWPPDSLPGYEGPDT